MINYVNVIYKRNYQDLISLKLRMKVDNTGVVSFNRSVRKIYNIIVSNVYVNPATCRTGLTYKEIIQIDNLVKSMSEIAISELINLYYRRKDKERPNWLDITVKNYNSRWNDVKVLMELRCKDLYNNKKN